jgi:hypothetical protein
MIRGFSINRDRQSAGDWFAGQLKRIYWQIEPEMASVSGRNPIQPLGRLGSGHSMFEFSDALSRICWNLFFSTTACIFDAGS